MSGNGSLSVGVVTSSISRHAGGLFQSVRHGAVSLSAAGHSVTVHSLADDHSDEDIDAWKPLQPNLHVRYGPRALGFAPSLSQALFRAGYDVLHQHGLWMYPSVAVLRQRVRGGTPTVISPRGMLDPWALRNSAWKKRLARCLFEDRNLRRAACLHALGDAEAWTIRALGLENPIAVIPNGVDLPAAESIASEDGRNGFRTVLFLGRLHPKKGIEPLLRGWSACRATRPDLADGWRLVVAGWDDGGHAGVLRNLADELGLGDRVSFPGALYGEAKEAAFRQADAFVLPSFSEGLPMAVLEAWAFGLPVLMTPQCNLPEGFEAGAALSTAPEAGSVARGLADLFELSAADRRAMGGRGRRLVERRFAWPGIAARLADVYRWLAGGGARPACVRLD